MLQSLQENVIDKPEIYLYQNGYAHFDSDWKCISKGDAFTRLYYVKKGHGFFTFDGKSIPMDEGGCYLIPPGTAFSYECYKGEEIEKLYFHFSLTTFEDYDLFACANGIFEIPISEVGAQEIFNSFGKDHYWDMFQTRTILYQTVFAFLEKCGIKTTQMQTYSETVHKTLKFIQQNLSVQLETEDIAQSLFISESTIRKLFKAETGKTIGTYIDELIFLEAKRMLIKKVPIKDISTKLGFCDQFYFSRRFKKKCGISPSQYCKETIL